MIVNAKGIILSWYKECLKLIYKFLSTGSIVIINKPLAASRSHIFNDPDEDPAHTSSSLLLN